MNLKDIFTEYAAKQRKLCAEAYKNNIGNEHYFDSTYDPIKNAPEPPLPSFWTKEKPEPQKGLLLAAIKLTYSWYYELHEITKIDDGSFCYWATVGDGWGDYEDLRADLYMILPGVEK